MKHKEKTDAPTMTLAIQTMRNSIMVGVFIGGGVLNLAVSTANEFNDLNNSDGRMKARTCVLAACCICSFLCWVNVIRYCAHLGYILGTMGYTPASTPTTISSSATSIQAQQAVNTSSTVPMASTGADDKHTAVNNPSSSATTTSATLPPTPSSSSPPHRSILDEPDKQVQFAVLIARYLMISFRCVLYSIHCFVPLSLFSFVNTL
jgi:hypothetical protein